MGQVLFDVHVESLSFTLPLDDFEVFVVHFVLHLFHLFFESSDLFIQFVTVELVFPCLRSEIFPNHAVFVQEVLVTDLNSVELFFEFIYVLFLGHFHLLKDFLLSMQLAIEVFSLGDRLVDLMLELDVLLMQYLDLAIGSVELDLCIFHCEDLVLELAPRLQEVRVRGCVLFLLFFVPLYPHISGLLLSSDDILQVLDPLVELLLCQIELPLNALLLDFDRLAIAFEVNHFLVKFFDLLGPLLERLISQRDHLLQTFVALDLVLQLYFQVVPCFVHLVQLFYYILVVLSCRVQLLLHLIVVDLEGAKLQLQLVNSNLGRVQVNLELLDFLLSFLVNL